MLLFIFNKHTNLEYALWIAQCVSGIINAVGFNFLYKKYTHY